MTIFDDIIGKVAQTAKKAVKKSNEVIEVTKLSMSLRETQESIDVILKDIGKTLYDEYKEGEFFTDEINTRFLKIDDLDKKIIDMREKLSELKKIKICPECNGENDKSASFCSECGKNIE